MQNQVLQLTKWIQESQRIVFFGGAGVSTDAGIPDFRSKDGIYTKNRNKYPYEPEEMLSVSMLLNNPRLHFQFVRENMEHGDIQPAYSHRFLAALEASGKDVAVVTQNTDGLHQAAGSQNVWALHGDNRRYCMACGKTVEKNQAQLDDEGIPRCPYCQEGIIRGNVVMFGENLDSKVVSGAIDAIAKADLLIVAGTSLNVYPAVSFIQYYPGDRFVVINKEPVVQAPGSLFIQAGISEVFQQVNETLALPVS